MGLSEKSGCFMFELAVYQVSVVIPAVLIPIRISDRLLMRLRTFKKIISLLLAVPLGLQDLSL